MNTSLILFSFLISGLCGAQTNEKFETKTSCPFKSEKYNLQIESEINLVKELYLKSTHFENESIKQQILYYKTDLKRQLQKLGIKAVLTDEQDPIHILGEVEKKMPQSLEINPVNHPDVQVTQDYIKNAIKLKKIPAGEAAVSIRYQTSFNAILCVIDKEQTNSLVKAIDLLAPIDPWLAHWMTPSSRQHLVKWEKSEFKIPAYFDSEYADIPHPEFAWYFWDPRFKGKSKSGVSYDAKQELKMIKLINHTKVGVLKSIRMDSTQKISSFIFDSKKESISATVIFGILNPKMLQLKFSEFFNEFSTGENSDWNTVTAKILNWNQKSEIDDGSLYATRFLLNLSNVLKPESIQFKFSQAENLLILSALFKESSKKIKIKFFFGPTDVLAGEKPTHWNAAYEGLAFDDIVFYMGHSGLGANFNWDNIKNNSTLSYPLQAIQKRNRIIGIFSCYSASYFDRDLSQFLGDQSMLILTGSEYTNARGPIGILDWVDRSFRASEPIKISNLSPKDFLIFKLVGLKL